MRVSNGEYDNSKPQEKRKFVEKVTHLTSPGWLWGAGARESVGLPPDRRPTIIISDMGIFRFDEKTKEAYLDSIVPERRSKT
jgi:glutaconate CoA-transferase subunit B